MLADLNSTADALLVGTRRLGSAMPLEEVIAGAIEQGVKLVACTTTMDVVGFKREELLDGVARRLTGL